MLLNVTHNLRFFGSRMLRRIFGSKREEATRSWRKFHSEELHNSYSPPDI
jgi:hypothetical protein